MIESAAVLARAHSLPAPSASALLSQLHLTPLAPIAVTVAAGWYVRSLLRLTGPRWPSGRTTFFFLGLTLVAVLTLGGFSAYSTSLFWAWTTQILLLMLVAPVLLVAGQPVELARRTGGRRLPALAAGPMARLVGNPFVGPLLVPVLSVGLFFGPLPGWSVQWPLLGWILQLAVVLVGGLIVLPLLAVGDERASLYIGVAMVIGVLELVVDAVPGLVLRLQTHLSSSFAEHRHLHPWSGSALHDQQAAGGVLWAVAELIDLPFLVLVFLRWVRADAREAGAVDSILDAEAIVRQAHAETGPLATGDVPWWQSDPQFRDRVRRGDSGQPRK